MSDAALRRLAAHAGLQPRWHDYRGIEHDVAPDTLRAVLMTLGLPCASPAQIAESEQALAAEVARPQPPPEPVMLRALGIADLASPPVRGLSVQVQALRHAGDGGLGAYTALVEWVRATAAHGADALALSPLHAPFLADPTRFSPYSPSHRRWLNPLHLDPFAAAAALGLPLTPAADTAAELRSLEALDLIDWPAAVRARLALLRSLFDHGSRQGGDAFGAFCESGRASLEDHARFDLLCKLHGSDWRRWPAALRDPRSRAVAELAQRYAREVAFHCFLQWLADRALAGVQAAAHKAGMALGLVADLAIGTDPGGSEAWSSQGDMLGGVTLGAPPDELNARGQNWGLTTFSPRALRDGGGPLTAILQAVLKHAGGLRIDHVLGLNRLWLIPDGAEATAGVYLRYPLGTLLRALAVESRRARAVIVGEDLGTVPDGLRPRLEASGLMGLRVLWFMREHGLFIEPARWPAGAVATTSTHDTPTVAGWWRAAPANDRRALWDAFIHAGVAAGAPPQDPAPVLDAAAHFVTRTPAQFALLPVEDLSGLEGQVNVPGTTDEHPNWRRRLPAGAARMLAEPATAARLADFTRIPRSRARTAREAFV